MCACDSVHLLSYAHSFVKDGVVYLSTYITSQGQDESVHAALSQCAAAVE